MRAVSLFTGAGGLDIGCETAGFMTVLAIEADSTARNSLALNRGLFPLLDFDHGILDDITEVDFHDALERAGLAAGGKTGLDCALIGLLCEVPARGSGREVESADRFDVFSLIARLAYFARNRGLPA